MIRTPRTAVRAGRPVAAGRPVPVLLLAGAMLLIAAGCSETAPQAVDAPRAQAAPIERPAEPPAEPVIHTVTPTELAAVFDNALGKPLVVNFWATWCQPCVKETPELAKFYEDRGDVGAEYVSVVILSDIEDRVRPFMKERKIPFPVYYLDAQSPDEFLQILDWPTEWDGALPATFVFNREGDLTASWFEEVTAEQITEAIG